MEKKDLIIIGTGGMAREVRWVIEECNKIEEKWNILGWVSQEKAGLIVAELPILGGDDWLLSYNKPVDVVIAIGNGIIRKNIAKKYSKNPYINFPNIIAPSAEVSRWVKLGKGAIIMNKSVMTVDIEAGDFFLCNYGCTIGHDCKFEDFVTINPGVKISGSVSIEECSTVGVGASVIQGIYIGKEAFVGAGAVVIRDVEDGSTVVGVPAKPLDK